MSCLGVVCSVILDYVMLLKQRPSSKLAASSQQARRQLHTITDQFVYKLKSGRLAELVMVRMRCYAIFAIRNDTKSAAISSSDMSQ